MSYSCNNSNNATNFRGNIVHMRMVWKTSIITTMAEDMHMSFDEFKREVTRWRHKWLLVEDGIPQPLVETLDFSIPEIFYPGIAVTVKTLLT